VTTIFCTSPGVFVRNASITMIASASSNVTSILSSQLVRKMLIEKKVKSSEYIFIDFILYYYIASLIKNKTAAMDLLIIQG